MSRRNKNTLKRMQSRGKIDFIWIESGPDQLTVTNNNNKVLSAASFSCKITQTDRVVFGNTQKKKN